MVKSQQSSTDWSQYHGDSGHTGYTTSNGPTTNNLLWSFSLKPYGKIEGYSAAVANGLAYFGSQYGNLTCVNAATGALVWNYNTNSFEISSPAVANGLVYFGCTDGNLYCLNAQTGALVWIINSTNTAFSVGDAPLAVSNGLVYFSDTWTLVFSGGSYQTYANITCANATTGTLVWGYGVAFSISNYETAPTVAKGYVYFTDGIGNVACVNASNGALIWSKPNGGYTPSVANGDVYYGDGVVFYCLNAATGASVWNYTTGGANYAVPVIANGNVYFGSEDGNFYCLNAQTGTFVWKYAVPNSYVFTGSVSGNGYVYFGGNNDYIYCLNAQNGTPVWQYQTGGSVDSMPAIANGILYVGSWDCVMYAFGASSSTVTPTTPTLTLQSSSASVTSGQTVTLSGTISPTATGTVTLSQSVNGSAFQQIATPTLTNGGYSYQLTISQLGTYEFQASFAGNSQLNPAQSTTVTVSASPSSENPGQSSGPNYGLYAGIIVIVIIIIIAAYYMLVMRGKTK